MPTRITSRPTRISTPRLSEIARHVVVPAGVVSTGWPAVRAKCRELDITFQAWQDAVGRIILGKRADGKYAATVGGTVISIPRQVGKTFLVGAMVFALCLLFPNLTVIWTAHRLRTANETFASMQAMARKRKIRAHVAKVLLGSGEEEIRFKNGSRIMFGARERGFGRGFQAVDVLIFDEAQILTENAIDDMVPATNQSRHPAGALLLFMGTPPKPTDPGEVFRRKRAEALSGEDRDTAYIEFSADRGASPDDWRQVEKANPSYPKFTPREAILRMRRNLSVDSFMREALGIWDEEGTVLPGWGACVAREWSPEPAALALAVSRDRDWASFGVASGDEIPVLGVPVSVEDDEPLHRPGVDWVIPEARRLYEAWSLPVVGDKGGPASSLLDELEAEGIAVIRAQLSDYLDACGRLYDLVQTGGVAHLGDDDPSLQDAVVAAARRDVGDRWAWGRKSGDITALEAVTLALWAVERSSIPAIY